MITEYIRYRLDPPDADQLESAYARAADVLRASPHCVDFDVTRGHEEPERVVVRIRWDSMEGHLQGFRRSEGFASFLRHVGPFREAIEEMSHYTPAGVAGEGGARPPSLFEWAGGAAALETLCQRFYELVHDDELLSPMFAEMRDDHPQRVATWLGEVFGGPARYTDELGGYPAMLRHHVALAISEPQRRRWVNLLQDAADDVGVPADPAFRAAFVGYLEWGTRLAVQNSRPGEEPPPEAPVPRWGWGVAPPFTG
jgi:truncated hemoglobin YjbI/quinol monooxygenase YgiN